MKAKTIFIIGALFSLSLAVNSQQPLPSDADAFYQKAMTQINTRHIIWLKRTAMNVNSQKMDESSIRTLTNIYGVQYNLNDGDIEALVSLVMIQAAKDAEQDLKITLEEMKKTNGEKQKIREAQENMEKNKNSITRPMLDSFRAIVSPRINTTAVIQNNNIAVKQTNRTQTIQPVNKTNTESIKRINTSENISASATDIKQVKDDLKTKLDSMNEMSEMTSLRLQMMMDRRSKFISTLSNIMKKISQTQDTIVQNLK